MNKKKILVLAMTLSIVAILAMGATLAYFTDVETAENVFTVGGVDITLTEPNWDKDDAVIMPGKVIAKDPTITNVGESECYAFLKLDMNKYVSLINLIGVHYYNGTETEYPGFTAFVTELAENAALREEVLEPWFQGINHANWTVMNLDEITALVENVAAGTNANRLTVKLGYNGTLAPEAFVKFMDSFTMPETVTQSMMNGEDAYFINGVSKSDFNTTKADFKMNFTAYAIQVEELDTLEDAYVALNKLAD